jgi:hypothetical protein
VRRRGSLTFSAAAPAQVLRASPLFVWRDDKGVQWRDTLRQSARKEFEAARRAALSHANALLRQSAHPPRRYLTDGEEVTRLLIAGRDALDQVLEKARSQASHSLCVCSDCFKPPQFLTQRQRIIEDEERAVREGRPPPSSLPPHERPKAT